MEEASNNNPSTPSDFSNVVDSALNNNNNSEENNVTPTMDSAQIQNPQISSEVSTDGVTLQQQNTEYEHVHEPMHTIYQPYYGPTLSPTEVPPSPRIFNQFVTTMTPVPPDALSLVFSQRYITPNYECPFPTAMSQPPVMAPYSPIFSSSPPPFIRSLAYTDETPASMPVQQSYHMNPAPNSANPFGQTINIAAEVVPNAGTGQIVRRDTYSQACGETPVPFKHCEKNMACGHQSSWFSRPQIPAQNRKAYHSCHAIVEEQSRVCNNQENYVHFGASRRQNSSPQISPGLPKFNRTRVQSCSFSNGNHRSEDISRFYKTQMCSSFIHYGHCNYDPCRFAHNKSELRPKPTVRATCRGCEWRAFSMNKRKPCFAFMKQGVCQFGDTCSYSHNVTVNASPTHSVCPTVNVTGDGSTKASDVTKEATEGIGKLDLANENSLVSVRVNYDCAEGGDFGFSEQPENMERLCRSAPLKRAEMEKSAYGEEKNRSTHRGHHRGTGYKKPNVVSGPHPALKPNKEDGGKNRKQSKD